MNKILLSCVGLLATPASAAHKPPAFNLGVASDYRYRGISQTRLKSALQGGAALVIGLKATF
jgi:hypothetical protein